MSREDPQVRVRIPVELKEKIEIAAKENTRSMNAEIVQRLEVSFLSEIPDDNLITAKDALLIVNQAKEALSSLIFKRTFDEINKKIRLGQKSFHISLSDLDLENIDDDDFESLFAVTFKKLKELGYSIWDEAWDANGFMVEIPKT